MSTRNQSYNRWLYGTLAAFSLLVVVLSALYGYRWVELSGAPDERGASQEVSITEPTLITLAHVLEHIAETLPDDIRCERFSYQSGQQAELIVAARSLAVLYSWYEKIKKDELLPFMLIHTEPYSSDDRQELVRGVLRGEFLEGAV